MAQQRSTSFDRRGFDEMIYLCLALFVAYGAVFFVYSKVLGLVLLLWNAVSYYTLTQMSKRPTNNPTTFTNWSRAQNRRRPVVLCLGDSLTHGTTSANVTDTLAARVCASLSFAAPEAQATFADPVWVVNAGQNGLSTHSILHERLNTALNVYPDYILLLIGTNDVQCMVPGSLVVRRIVRQNGLPEVPTLHTLERNVTGILHYIHESSPKVEVGVCTLPPMGEDLSSASNQCVRQANAVLERVVQTALASTDKVTLIPLFATLESILEKSRRSASWPFLYWMVPTLVLNPLYHVSQALGVPLSWNTLSSLFGYTVMSDGLHLNERGRDVVVDLAVEWLNRKSIAKAIAVKS